MADVTYYVALPFQRDDSRSQALRLPFQRDDSGSPGRGRCGRMPEFVGSAATRGSLVKDRGLRRRGRVQPHRRSADR